MIRYKVTGRYNRTFENVVANHNSGGIRVRGVIDGFAPIESVSDNMTDIVAGQEILLVTVPSLTSITMVQEG